MALERPSSFRRPGITFFNFCVFYNAQQPRPDAQQIPEMVTPVVRGTRLVGAGKSGDIYCEFATRPTLDFVFGLSVLAIWFSADLCGCFWRVPIASTYN
jgi:hypothetical protein